MRLLIGILLCCALSACFTAGKRGGDSVMVTYDFGPVPNGLLSAPRKSPLAIEVRVPLWFDSLGIDYRLLYRDPTQLREYAKARWVGPPAQLIQQRLIKQLDLSMAGQGQSRCLLRVEITEFSQLFTAPDVSKGVLLGRAVLLDRSRRQVAELDVNIEKAALSQDARGGVAAMAATVEQLAAELLLWERKSGVCLA